jgi:hypothetical protein
MILDANRRLFTATQFKNMTTLTATHEDYLQTTHRVKEIRPLHTFYQLHNTKTRNRMLDSGMAGRKYILKSPMVFV